MEHKHYRMLAVFLTAVCIGSFSVPVGADEDEYTDFYEAMEDNEYVYEGTPDEYGSDENYYDNETYTDENNYVGEYTDGDNYTDDTEDGGEYDTENETDFDEEENSHQQEELQKKHEEIEEKIQLTEQEIENAKQEIESLQQQIADLSRRIKTSSQHILTLDTEIKEKQKQVDDKSAEIEDVLALLRVRLRAIHTAGDTAALEIILGAKNFSDFIDKAEAIKVMSSYDNRLILSIQEQADALAEEKRALQDKKTQEEEEKRRLEKNMDTINQLSEKNTKLIESLMSDHEKLQHEQEETEAKQEELQRALDAYKKQLREKQEESQNENEIIVTPSTGGYVWPCPGFTYLTSTFDEWRGENNHGALDIAEAGIYGAKVVACYDGVVFAAYSYCEHDWGKDSSCGCGGGYGNYVMIDHGNGKISIYGHLSGVTVEAGQTVTAGQLIGYVGSTGYSTGAHLHFETRYNNVRYDPMSEY